jgi:hypothetical protein
MVAIIKAMGETKFKPRAKWWGYVKDGKRYLMRYHHNFAIFSATEVLFSNAETRTDKAGVNSAIKYFKEHPELFSDLTKEKGDGTDVAQDVKISPPEEIFGHVIASYSRKQAIEDGVLVDFEKVSPGIVKEAGISYPMAITRVAWQLIDDAVEKGGKDLDGVIWDMLTMFRFAAQKSTGNQIIFEMLIWEKHVGKDRLMKFKAICSAGDTPEPVITIMLPNED